MLAARSFLFVAMVLALAGASGAGAQSASPGAGSVDADVTGLRDCSPPCGYILPTLDINVSSKPTCPTARGVVVDRSQCTPLPLLNESVSFEGTVTWSWDITQDGTYPSDPNVPITISFGGSESNPTWMKVDVVPATFVIDAAALFAPENMKTDTDDPDQPQLWFWYQRPITVTVTRTAEPTLQELEVVHGMDDVVRLHLKARSNASGAYFREAFNVESFRFDALGRVHAAPSDADAPSVQLGFAAVAITGTAFLLRRRRAA